MCTVTLIARGNGYALGMNRDEKLTRVPALPPARHRFNGREVLFPSEPSGGTWIGVNDSGATFALINWYSVTARAARQHVSRGEIVRSVLPFDSRELVDASFANLPLLRVNPFRLIGVFANHKAVVEWRWNLQRLEHIEHSWQTRTWISSGFDEPGAQQSRSKTFQRALGQSFLGSADWLRRLHRSHAAGRGPYSHCMHRADAATVSYTEISVSENEASMRYIPGPPCCTSNRPMITSANSPKALTAGSNHSNAVAGMPHIHVVARTRPGRAIVS